MAARRARSRSRSSADGYERLAARGYGYGPAFKGLTATWVRGDEVFAEVRLPDAAGGVNGFGVHPALLDAAMHALVMGDQIADQADEVVLPFSWQGVSLHAAGASAVRARIAPAGTSTVSRRSRSSSPTGWDCRCCRCARWWLAR